LWLLAQKVMVPFVEKIDRLRSQQNYITCISPQ